ncbi:putative SWI/SNF-related matrix-associated actin-dependent regulator of chromatin subfamily A member 3-like 1 [Silene latifolia]|uniref:putative SWI/SNF-related matrix-associated actin-dependent regulator of chromatin subfamily A member 3-like 1 n=1 Tax=Silene latifolia TaxID=37657 RepID=UPI003D77213D
MSSFNLDDDDNDNDDYTQDPQVLSLSSTGETYMVGFIIANIVGIQYYSGRISGREMVGLVREPLNVYDENAIKVLNTRGYQVGHIERNVAKVIAPLLDCQMIIAEGIVPKPQFKNANRYRIPCQIHIFSPISAIDEVKSVILRGGLELMSQESAAFALSEAEAVKERKNSKGVKTLDEIFKLVDENVGRKEGLSAAKLVPPKEVVVPELFEHQKEGLGWLVERENSEDLPPFWEEKDGNFVNVLTNYQTSVRPEPLKGGIFADDMGLGKTLTLLSLIAYDKYKINAQNVDAIVAEDYDEREKVEASSSKKSKKRGRKPKSVASSIPSSSSRKKQKVVNTVDDDNVGSESKTTLVVCTPSVFSVWISQLCEHTKRGSLDMYMYYGQERTNDVEELKKYDMVLTSYNTLSMEDDQVGSPVKKMNWRRIILDEGHLIKNADAKQSRAVTALIGKRRWVVSGTPVQNSSYDLFSLMAFLKFDPFSNKSYWNRLVQRPLAQGDPKGLERLQVLMATVTLRRTKEQSLIGLPSKSIQTCYVELMQEERELYDRMEEEAKQVVKNYINIGNVTRNYTTVLSIILRLRQISTDVALCPHDIKSLLPADNVQDVSNNPELLEKMMLLLQDSEDFDCPICISPPTDAVITCCAHIYCRSCIIKTLKRTKPSCPMCRHPISESDLYTAPPSENSTTGTSSKLSSKVSVLLKLLSESKDKSGVAKSVVFSQFRKMLLLLEEPLKAAGFKTLRLDGTMSAKKRAQVIETFHTSESSSPTVLLASLKASGTGINLTAASVVYLLEPWWNPATEEQAMDRVHRIGQKKDVKIVRIIAKDTIEERVLELQEKKRALAKGALGRKGSKEKREINAQDLCNLISLSS